MDDNPILVDEYRTYREYMKENDASIPLFKRCNNRQEWKRKYSNIRSVMFTDHDGTEKPAYPACYEALNYGIEAEEETSFESKLVVVVCRRNEHINERCDGGHKRT